MKGIGIFRETDICDVTIPISDPEESEKARIKSMMFHCRSSGEKKHPQDMLRASVLFYEMKILIDDIQQQSSNFSGRFLNTLDKPLPNQMVAACVDEGCGQMQGIRIHILGEFASGNAGSEEIVELGEKLGKILVGMTFAQNDDRTGIILHVCTDGLKQIQGFIRRVGIGDKAINAFGNLHFQIIQ
jgi:hypothetical protein